MKTAILITKTHLFNGELQKRSSIETVKILSYNPLTEETTFIDHKGYEWTFDPHDHERNIELFAYMEDALTWIKENIPAPADYLQIPEIGCMVNVQDGSTYTAFTDNTPDLESKFDLLDSFTEEEVLKAIGDTEPDRELFLCLWGNWDFSASLDYEEKVELRYLDFFTTSGEDNGYIPTDQEKIFKLAIGESHEAEGGNHKIFRIR